MPRSSSSHIAKPRKPIVEKPIVEWLHEGLSDDQIRQLAALPLPRSVFLTVLVERSKSLSRDAAFSSALREVLGPRAESFSEALRDTLREFFERGVLHGRQET